MNELARACAPRFSRRLRVARALSLSLGAGTVLFLAPRIAEAAPVAIIQVHPTGVDDANALIGDSQLDAHWKAVATTDPGRPGPDLFALPTGTYPLDTSWVSNTATGRWLTLEPASATTANNTVLDIETTINLAGYLANTASLTLELSVDDDYVIKLNGVDTMIARNGAYTQLATHTIAAGWAAGNNTLRVTVSNTGGGPSGILVSTISGTAEPDVADPDNDGLSNYLERLLGTDPANPDTDGDGLKDGEEDKNKNGAVDATETDPTKADTDSGGVNDGIEVKFGANPLDPADDAGYGVDTDTDTLPDAYETKIGTDPTKADSDGDGITDGNEIGTDLLHPRDSDTDATIDALDTDDDGDTILTKDELGAGGAAAPVDTDGDTRPDYLDDDDDNDTILTKDEVADATKAKVSDDVDGDGKKNWLDDDADGDGAKDGVEGRGDTNGNGVPNYLDPTGSGTDGGVDSGTPDSGRDAGSRPDGAVGSDGSVIDDDTVGNIAGGGISCSVPHVGGSGTSGAIAMAIGAVVSALGLRRRKR